ncbi:putative oxidoreductase/Short-chain dehydrogenase [Labilithrix luteola]|uniref:Putative oxidoreductase/Short-chain dehydrogenase n=1 Tax=Labilithrix luteola TaxID=1391654 RepID=A0A0K1Q328_9BACT|nr:SDR family NAD(P)-dependent oxidoreductase [Labilithrix luteola]AKV00133.1 putative oxidoreductase/Short-chain dehydrogenase [Labilithrix luteola]
MTTGDTSSLGGKTFLVTGATSGVGLATVRGLVARGAEVLGASRSGAKGDATRGISLDLTVPSSIRRVQAELTSSRAHIDGLVHAAGGFYWEPSATEFGVDRAWAVNYLGHVMLTRALWSLLEAAPRGRVATVAGNPRLVRRAKLDSSAIERTSGGAFEVAGQALAARVAWTSRLARRTAGTRVTVLCFHPGSVRSNLGADGPWWWRALGPLWQTFASPTCNIAVSAASDPSLGEMNGALVDPSGRAHRFDDLDAALGDALETETDRLLSKL